MERMDNGLILGLEATILGRGLSLPTDQRKTSRNNNLLVVGAPGSSKSRGLVLPQIMQCNSNFITLDPKGALLREMEPGLREAGYDVMILDFSHPERSESSWNPLTYVRTQQDALSLAETLVTAYGQSLSEPFWDRTATQLAQSLIMATDIDPTVSHDLSGVLELARLLHERSRRSSRGYGARSEKGGFECGEPFLTEGLNLEDERSATALDARMGSYEFGEGELRKRREAIDSAQGRLDVLRVELREAVDAADRAIRNDADDERHQHGRRGRHGSYDEWIDQEVGIEGAWVMDVDNEEEMSAEAREALSDAREAYQATLAAKKELRDLIKSTPERKRCEVTDLYRNVRSSAGKTWRSVAISFNSALDQWRSPELLSMLSGGSGEIDLASLGEGRKALFVVVPDTRTELYPLVGVFMRQLVDQLVETADSAPSGRLEVPVRVILDDFATMCGGAWGSIEQWVNATRSREIWWEVVVQSLGQLEGMLGEKSAAAVIAGCDTHVFVGAPTGLATARYIASLMGCDERSILASGIDRQIVCIRGCAPTEVPRFQPEDHVNWPVFDLARFQRELEDNVK